MAHILLVDDDPEVVAGNAEAIESLGHSVSRTSTLAEAIESMLEEKPDLVVLEAMFGGEFSGFDFAHELAESHPDLPLIMLTRADEEFSPEEMAGQDRDGAWVPVQRYLAKPVLSDVLTYEIEHLLSSAL
jgi:DNA-binding response OmpR family regulator